MWCMSSRSRCATSLAIFSSGMQATDRSGGRRRCDPIPCVMSSLLAHDHPPPTPHHVTPVWAISPMTTPHPSPTPTRRGSLPYHVLAPHPRTGFARAGCPPSLRAKTEREACVDHLCVLRMKGWRLGEIERCAQRDLVILWRARSKRSGRLGDPSQIK